MRVATCDHRYRDWSILSLCFPSIHPFFGAANFGTEPDVHQVIKILLRLNSLLTCIWLAQLQGNDSLPWRWIPWYESHKQLQFFCPWILPPIYPSISEGKRWKRVWNRTSKATRWERFDELRRFGQTRLGGGKKHLKHFFGVIFWAFFWCMWQFWCPTIGCNTYRCAMLKHFHTGFIVGAR